MRLVDTHAHLVDKAFHQDREEMLQRAKEAGVAGIVCIGDTLASSQESLALAQEQEGIWATAGVHPHHALQAGEDLEARLLELLSHPLVVAVGEVGLDYHYDFAPRDVQHQVFRRQIRIARKVGKPLVIHSREANEDVVRILQEEKAEDVGGVFHCFWGDEELARTVLAMGFYVGVGGPVTFKKSEALRATLKTVPLDRLLVETDSPYLAPVPFRGKRNEPAYVVESARQLAAVKGLTPEELADVTTENARRLFRL